MITVVGVVREFHYREHRASTPTIFRPYRQELAQGYLVVRMRGPAVATETLRRAVEDAGGGATFIRSQSMDDLIAPQLATPRFDALLLSMFALAAIVLAAVGLYGIMASAVNQQTRELGIRMALGATSSGVRNMVMRQALAVAGSGDDCRARGRAGWVSSAHVDALRDHAVRPDDALVPSRCSSSWSPRVAAYIPARRATMIDPARALRAEWDEHPRAPLSDVASSCDRKQGEDAMNLDDNSGISTANTPRGAGGTPGGLGEFFVGLAMAAGGGYLLMNQVTVSSGLWQLWGYNAFGISLIPLLIGVGRLFFDGRSEFGWILTALGALVIVLGILTNLTISSSDEPLQHDHHPGALSGRTRAHRQERASESLDRRLCLRSCSFLRFLFISRSACASPGPIRYRGELCSSCITPRGS